MPQTHQAAWQSLLLVASIALAGGWLFLLWLVRVPARARVRAQPATAELGPEPPAVAGMLTHGGRVGDDVAAATLLDLAARHLVDLEQAGPQLSLCRLRPPGGADLAPYERRILSYLDALATDGVVPAPALAEGVSKPAGWWRKLRAEVVADTRARGLSRPRWSPFGVAVLGLPAALPAAGLLIWLVSVTGAGPTLGGRGIVGGTIAGALAGLALVRRLNADHLTTTGRAAAGHWLGVRAYLASDQVIAAAPPAAVVSYGRTLAYAAALGLARTAVSSLPVGAPANPRVGWSTYGTGQWHKVDISYSRRPSWGTDPRQLLTARLLMAIPPAGVAFLFLAVVPGLPAIAWTALAIMAVILVSGGRAVADLGSSRPVEGAVVRARSVAGNHDQQAGRTRADTYWIAVDDGRTAPVRAWRVSGAIYQQVNVGDVIRVRVSRSYGYVSGLELITHHPRADVEAGLPAWQREEGAARRRAVLETGGPIGGPEVGVASGGGGVSESTGDGPAGGPTLATLVTAADAAELLGAPAGAPQPLNPFDQIRGAAGNPLTRNAVLVACRWTPAAGGPGAADVFAGTGLAAKSLLGQLSAATPRAGGPVHRERLAPGVLLAGNVLVIVRSGVSAAVVLRDTDPQAAAAVLQRFAPVLAGRLGAGDLAAR